MLRNICSAK